MFPLQGFCYNIDQDNSLSQFQLTLAGSTGTILPSPLCFILRMLAQSTYRLEFVIISKETSYPLSGHKQD